MQFLGVAHQRPGFGPDPIDRIGVEQTEVFHFGGIEPGAVADGVGAAFLEWRIVEKGIGPRVDDFLGERRRLAQVTAYQGELVVFHILQQRDQIVDIHGFGQAVVDGLRYQRVVGNLALAGKIFLAGDLVREDMGDEIFGVHALPLGRHALPVAVALDRQRAGRVPAPAHFEHRSVKHGLDHDFAYGLAVEIAEHFVQREAVHRAKRQHDIVLVGRRLKLEIEGTAEALAQGQTPGPVEAAAEWRVDDEVHVAYLVEKTLHDDGVARGHHTQAAHAGMQVVDELRRGGGDHAEFAGQPGVGCSSAAFSQQFRQVSAQSRYRLGQLAAAAGTFAEPERNRRPRAMSVAHTHLQAIDPDHLPAMAAEGEHVAGQGFEREILVQCPHDHVLGIEYDLVVEHVGNRPAIGQRHELGAAPRPDTAVDGVEMQ